jgi:hypothetical protein
MANQRRGYPEDFSLRDLERTELTISIRALRLQPFTFIVLCAVITIGMPRWFSVGNRLTTFWYWVLVLAVALEAVAEEYERRWLQAFNDRWSSNPAPA